MTSWHQNAMVFNVRSYEIRSDQTEQVRSSQIRYHSRVRESSQMRRERAKSGRMKSEQVRSSQARSNQMNQVHRWKLIKIDESYWESMKIVKNGKTIKQDQIDSKFKSESPGMAWTPRRTSEPRVPPTQPKIWIFFFFDFKYHRRHCFAGRTYI